MMWTLLLVVSLVIALGALALDLGREARRREMLNRLR
jgi:hypothetical protein